MKEDNICFKKIEEKDLTLLHQWFQLPHVLKWYARGKSFSLNEIKKKYLPRITDDTIPSYIVYHRQMPVGYIQLYQVEHHLPEGIHEHHPLFDEINLKKIAGIDLFIADEKLLQTGFSSEMLDNFIHQYVIGNFHAILVDPVNSNIAALKFFVKNGFKRITSQDDNHLVMIKYIEAQNDLHNYV